MVPPWRLPSATEDCLPWAYASFPSPGGGSWSVTGWCGAYTSPSSCFGLGSERLSQLPLGRAQAAVSNALGVSFSYSPYSCLPHFWKLARTGRKSLCQGTAQAHCRTGRSNIRRYDMHSCWPSCGSWKFTLEGVVGRVLRLLLSIPSPGGHMSSNTGLRTAVWMFFR